MAGDLGFETTTWARRVLALIVDWAACTLVVVLLVGGFGAYYGNESRYASFITLGVFVLESALLTAASGGSFGQLATRLRVVRDDGNPSPPDLVRSVARQALIALVIPPLVYRPDGRGLHDILAGSAVVDLETFRHLGGAPATRKAP